MNGSMARSSVVIEMRWAQLDGRVLLLAEAHALLEDHSEDHLPVEVDARLGQQGQEKCLEDAHGTRHDLSTTSDRTSTEVQREALGRRTSPAVA